MLDRLKNDNGWWHYRLSLNKEFLWRVGLSLSQVESAVGTNVIRDFYEKNIAVEDVVSQLDFDDSDFDYLFR